MFGMGGTEILVILIVALLFLGPDKLPEAAKSISKGIRDIKKQSRVLQRTIEDDEHIGGAIRDLKSALRGEDEPYRPPKPRRELEESTPSVVALAEPAAPSPDPTGDPTAYQSGDADAFGDGSARNGAEDPGDAAEARPALTMPATAGEPDADAPAPSASEDAELAQLVKPAPNTIAHTPRTPAGAPPETPSEPKHG